MYKLIIIASKFVRVGLRSLFPILFGVAFTIALFSLADSIATSLDNSYKEVFTFNLSLKNIRVLPSGKLFSENQIHNFKTIPNVTKVIEILEDNFIQTISNLEPTTAEERNNSVVTLNLVGIENDKEALSLFGVTEKISDDEIWIAKSLYEKINKFSDNKITIGGAVEFPFYSNQGLSKTFKFKIKEIVDDSNSKNARNLGKSIIGLQKMKEISMFKSGSTNIASNEFIYTELILFYDKIEYAESISSALTSLGYQNSFALQNSLQISPLANVIRTVGFFAILIIFCGFVLILFNQYSNFLRSRSHDFGLLKTFGYSNLRIFFILLFEIVIIVIFCGILSILLYVPGFLIADNFMKDANLDLSVNISSFILSFGFFCVLFIFIVIFKIYTFSYETIIGLIQKT
jgi:ABC-type antimicrobial peptide transport system permease subunit